MLGLEEWDGGLGLRHAPRLRHYGFYRVLKPREPVVPAITNGSLPPSPRSEPLEELPGEA